MAKTSKIAAADPRAEAVFDLFLESLALSFKLRALGQRSGSVTSWGGGLWGLLRSLETEGPQTVPHLARSRPVARQHIQKLADDMAGQGLVEFIDNPAHKRSRLLRPTAKGKALYREITRDLMALCHDLAQGRDLGELKISSHTIRDLKDHLAAMIETNSA